MMWAVHETLRGSVETLQVWSNIRTVGNLKFSFHDVTCRDGVKFSEMTAVDFKLNLALDTTTSVKPSKYPEERSVRTT